MAAPVALTKVSGIAGSFAQVALVAVSATASTNYQVALTKVSASSALNLKVALTKVSALTTVDYDNAYYWDGGTLHKGRICYYDGTDIIDMSGVVDTSGLFGFGMFGEGIYGQ